MATFPPYSQYNSYKVPSACQKNSQNILTFTFNLLNKSSQTVLYSIPATQ